MIICILICKVYDGEKFAFECPVHQTIESVVAYYGQPIGNLWDQDKLGLGLFSFIISCLLNLKTCKVLLFILKYQF
jgi:hypothetical protein